jgi:hypothetical protein
MAKKKKRAPVLARATKRRDETSSSSSSRSSKEGNEAGEHEDEETPFPSRTKDNVTAFDYFNNPVFFNEDRSLDHFVARSSRRDSTELQVPVDQFFGYSLENGTTGQKGSSSSLPL